MIKATMTKVDGRTVLVIGLSFNNLDRLRSEPLNTFINIDGLPMNLPIDVLIMSGETEAHMADFFADKIAPDTKVHIDPKLRS